MNFIRNVLFAMEQCEPQIHIFSWYHALIFFGTFAIFHIIIHNQNDSLQRENRAKKATIFMLILQLTLYAWYIVSPESFILKALPLYTCRLALYLFILGQFFNNEKCLKLATCWGVYGGISGLVFPTVFKYPFPHILQIATIVLHIYIFLVGSYYLFVKKIGITLKDTIWCSLITASYILVISILNSFLGTNYISTTRMPAHLINYVGLNLPDWLCLPAVMLGYVAVTFFQYWAVNKTIIYQTNKNNIIKEDESYGNNLYE